MSESWKRWEGRTVDGRFPLQSCLGASDHSAVFLTLAADYGKAAIKLVPADPAGAEKQLLRWKIASEVTHPSLIRIFAMGRCELDGTKLLYLVMEYAEENLAQIIPERALTAEEVRAMLPPLLRALQSVHDKKFVLGRIQPSNILAIGDQVKLASDALGMANEKSRGATAVGPYDPPEAATGVTSTAAGDVWQLGMTLVEALTQHLPVWDRARQATPNVPVTVPEPFRGIAGYCLRLDPGKRWTVAKISDCLEAAPVGMEGVATTPAQAAPVVSPAAVAQETTSSALRFPGRQKIFAKWPYGLGLAAVVVVAVVLISRPKPSSLPAEVQATGAQQSAASESARPAPAATGGDEATPANADEIGVVQRVMPQVSPGARRTIQGRIIVRVKVKVDDAGNVEKAKLESGRGSKYFSRVALESARDWKFAPAAAGESGAREWKLQFAFSRTKTEASAVRAKR